jgi:hypothetical protein
VFHRFLDDFRAARRLENLIASPPEKGPAMSAAAKTPPTWSDEQWPRRPSDLKA